MGRPDRGRVRLAGGPGRARHGPAPRRECLEPSRVALDRAGVLAGDGAPPPMHRRPVSHIHFRELPGECFGDCIAEASRQMART